MLIGLGRYITAIVIVALSFVISFIHYRKQSKKALYSYKSAGFLGGTIFLEIGFFFSVYELIPLIRQCSENKRVYLSFQMIFEIMTARYTVLLLPFMLLLLLIIVFSNIQLVRHEGMSLHNFFGFICVLCVTGIILLMFDPHGWIYSLITSLIQSTEINSKIYGIYSTFFDLTLSYFDSLILGVILYQVKIVRHKPKYDQDFIIILGCSIDKHGNPYPLLRGRIDRALDFAAEQERQTQKQVCFVASGGQGADECISEAESISRYLQSKGIPRERILLENKSVNTFQNMQFSKAIIDQIRSDANVIFSTSNYHVFRSGIYARHAGLRAEGIGAKTKNYFWPNASIREFIALLEAKKRIHFLVLLVLLLLSILGQIQF